VNGDAFQSQSDALHIDESQDAMSANGTTAVVPEMAAPSASAETRRQSTSQANNDAAAGDMQTSSGPAVCRLHF
jgi:hypothetical protein